ncbi:MAG TPA: HD domain-containing phosphohydrolase [Solirubrobacterales bacterium]
MTEEHAATHTGMAPTAEKVKSRGPAASKGGSRPSANGNGKRGARFDGPKPAETVPAESAETRPTSGRDAGSQIAAAMLEAADPTTSEHSDDVELVVVEICRRLSVNGHEREDILLAARLHDVGKVAIPPEVLEKKGPLDDSEWKLIKEHTITGERILKSVPELEPAARLVRHSHEHFDGSGYPDGLEGDDIPLGSRIILCADAFHAIRSDRPYRKGRSTPAALKEMQRCAGSQFDPDVVEALDASVRRARRSRRRTLPPRLALLFAMLAIGGGGAFAAERGWIPSPIPGIGPERSADSAADGPGADAASATEAGAAAGAAGESTTSDDDVAGTGDASKGTRGSGQGDSAGAAADRRGDGGRASASGAAGAAGGNQDGPGGSAGNAAGAAGAGGGSAGGGDSSGVGSSGGEGGGPVGGSPGNSGSAPGQSGSAPGQSGSAPGQSGGAPPGQSGSAPGLSGSTPGQSGTAPGQSGISPGNSAGAPGQSGAAPGNSANAPGQGGGGGNPHL